MGIVDSKWFTVRCDNCNVEESVAAHEKGSAWQRGSWQSVPAMKSFRIVASGSGDVEPEIKQASCMRCGSNAHVESGYGSLPK